MKIESDPSRDLNDDERLLLNKCLTGDPEAWEEFCQCYYSTIASIASWRRWRFEAQDLEDVTQDILTELIRSLKTFEFKSDFRTFVYKIAVRTCIARLRKKSTLKRNCPTITVPVDPIESGTETAWGHICIELAKNQEELLLEKETIHRVKKALLQLEEYCKELIRQRYFAEIPFREIARKTGVKTNTLVIQLKRCLIRLLGILNEET
jgi:RNA polymerase sigma-70 factor, ECF subfamily